MNSGAKFLVCVSVLSALLIINLVASLVIQDSGLSEIIAIVGGVAGLFIFGYAFVMLVQPLQKFLSEIKTSVLGPLDLSRRLDTDLGDYSDVAEALNTLFESLSDIMKDLLDVADNVAAASNHLAGSSNKISDSAQRQSRQATEVAAAMEQMTATVNDVAHNATKVADQAKNGSDIANEGATVVRRTIDSMETIAGSVRTSAATVEELGKRSAEIGQIIGVISDIADLTNLLSLNAAIEAARAGEHGRGFAVVADEVRKLAEKTSKATNEVRETIGAIQSETEEAVVAMRSGTADVQHGVEHAGKAEHSLADIVSSYGTVNDMVHQIATAAEEQSASASEIARHVEAIANISKDVNGGISDIAGSANELAQISERMRSRLAALGMR